MTTIINMNDGEVSIERITIAGDPGNGRFCLIVDENKYDIAIGRSP